jgi:translation initiation factor eIF-2B subunit beta
MAERPSQESEGHDVDTFAQSIKPLLMEAIQDVLDELETVYDNVSKGAKDHIHSELRAFPHCHVDILTLVSSEIILTIGKSATVEAFLKSASHHRNFTVIVAETAPSLVVPDIYYGA